MNVLAGDVGGTKTWLQVADVTDGRICTLYEQRFDSRRFASFEAVMRSFIDNAPRKAIATVQSVCLAVAGPVENGESGKRIKVTNLAWSLEESSLVSTLHIDRVKLINDFEAVGYGTEALSEADLLVVQAGMPLAKANRMTLGAGTGFGFCQSLWTGDRYLVVPSEAGHTGFAAADTTQLDLQSYLLGHGPYVATEDVLSGPGLKAIFDYLGTSRCTGPGDELRAALDAGDPAAVIADFGKDGRDALAGEALDIFIKIYGAVAGNLALLSLPYGGIYIAGGIAPKLADSLINGRFIAAFRNKGKMSELMMRFPLYIVRDEKIGLKGAALVASRQ